MPTEPDKTEPEIPETPPVAKALNIIEDILKNHGALVPDNLLPQLQEVCALLYTAVSERGAA